MYAATQRVAKCEGPVGVSRSDNPHDNNVCSLKSPSIIHWVFKSGGKSTMNLQSITNKAERKAELNQKKQFQTRSKIHNLYDLTLS